MQVATLRSVAVRTRVLQGWGGTRVTFCRAGPEAARGDPCPLPAEPGSAADVFISLGCSPWDTENVITEAQAFISSQIPAAGGRGRTAACSVRGGSAHGSGEQESRHTVPRVVGGVCLRAPPHVLGQKLKPRKLTLSTKDVLLSGWGCLSHQQATHSGPQWASPAKAGFELHSAFLCRER